MDSKQDNINTNRIRYPYIKIGRVLAVDVYNSYLLTGRAGDINSQIRYNVNRETVILDQRGRRISLRDLRRGEIVRVTHAPNMTFSIPPQTMAYRIQIISQPFR